ncbi:heterokaryon incompatibility protein-domain-containing protein [Xylariaceae sp. FL0016]|nr:heterokaryon incompatibility protein-domain-containing protein [Xylariaceae sp. FL0016]
MFKDDGYAILSHRWVGHEITFEQIQKFTSQLQNQKDQPTVQLAKIRGACDRAREQGIKWMWIDTCCIDKSSSSEETEVLNSMFRWYRDAKLCITLFNDVRFSPQNPRENTFDRIEGGASSVWFTRGWTLQELLAPKYMQFYDMDWQYMGTKAELAHLLARITRIDVSYLTGERHFSSACIASKMSWMASRITQRPEDMAYSMLGIFDVFLTPRYGEGMRAFMRLQQHLLSTLTDESLFAWKFPTSDSPQKHATTTGSSGMDEYKLPRSQNSEAFPRLSGWEPEEWALLVPSPSCFFESTQLAISGSALPRLHGGFSMTQQGLQMPIFDPGKARTLAYYVAPLWIFRYPFKRMLQQRARAKDLKFPLNCWRTDSEGRQVRVQLRLRRTAKDSVILKRARCHEFEYTYKEPSISRAQRAEPHTVLLP